MADNDELIDQEEEVDARGIRGRKVNPERKINGGDILNELIRNYVVEQMERVVPNWNETIQVLDGLYVTVDNPSVEGALGYTIQCDLNGQTYREKDFTQASRRLRDVIKGLVVLGEGENE